MGDAATPESTSSNGQHGRVPRFGSAPECQYLSRGDTRGRLQGFERGNQARRTLARNPVRRRRLGESHQPRSIQAPEGYAGSRVPMGTRNAGTALYAALIALLFLFGLDGLRAAAGHRAPGRDERRLRALQHRHSRARRSSSMASTSRWPAPTPRNAWLRDSSSKRVPLVEPDLEKDLSAGRFDVAMSGRHGSIRAVRSAMGRFSVPVVRKRRGGTGARAGSAFPNLGIGSIQRSGAHRGQRRRATSSVWRESQFRKLATLVSRCRRTPR